MLLASTSRSADRRGFTLAELLVAFVLIAIVGASIMNLLVKQQRFYRTSTDLMETRSQIRQAVSILPTDLRGISPGSGDIRDIGSSFIDFDATIGTGIVCEALAAVGTQQDVYLAPRYSSVGPLTGWSSTPRTGDRATLYNIATGFFSAPRTIVPVAGLAAEEVDVGCAGSPLVPAADAAKKRIRMRLDLTGGIAPAVNGTPIRILRRVRYGLFTWTDGQAYLGFQEDDGFGGLTTSQPVAGPYRPAAADTTSGLSISYFDVNGAQLPATIASAPQVARIDVVVRALTRNRGSEMAGMYRRADGKYGDFDRFSVALRNRW